MLSLYLLFALSQCLSSLGYSPQQDLLQSYIDGGFKIDSPQFTSSALGKAACAQGTTKLNLSAQNVDILYPVPTSNEAVAELYVEFYQAGNTTISTTAVGEAVTVEATYTIFTKLCVPANASSQSDIGAVQILTHGAWLDHSYWDFAPHYSFVDTAAEAGYATLSYDRLGSGLSDHPDPVKCVQLGAQVEVAHALTTMVQKAFPSGCNIVANAHSLGAIVILGQLLLYPKDAVAVIISGLSPKFEYVGPGTIAVGGVNAHTLVGRDEFRDLPDGYFAAVASVTQQLPTFRYPNYDQNIFKKAMDTRGTLTMGEQFSLAAAFKPNRAYTGLIDVVDGENDYLYCGGNCSFPENQAALLQSAFFPSAEKGAQSFLLPGAGHNVFLHHNATMAYNQIIDFLQESSI